FTTEVSVPGDDPPRAATSLDLSPSPAIRIRSTPSPAGLIRSPDRARGPAENVPMIRDAASSSTCNGASAGGPSDGSPQIHPACPCPGPHLAAVGSPAPAVSVSLTPSVFTHSYFHVKPFDLKIPP